MPDTEAAAAPRAPATAEIAETHPLHAIVDAWFASHFHNSVVSRDTEIHNFVHAAVQDLKLRLVS